MNAIEIDKLIQKTEKLRKRVVKSKEESKKLLLGSVLYDKKGKLRKVYNGQF
jgi:hypothetical protein